MKHNNISVLSEKDLKYMRVVCQKTARLLSHLSKMVINKTSTLKINEEAEQWVKKNNAINAPLGYHGYPKSICTSINNVICHGIPAKNDVLKIGDIINIDVSLKFNEYFGDTSKTFFVGKPTRIAKKLVLVTEKSMLLAIQNIFPGSYIGDIGYIIKSYVDKFGFKVVRDFVGHGIGRGFHMDPQVHHIGKKKSGLNLTEGMTFTIEPMINLGSYESKIMPDQWTVVTKDNTLSAQFEHSVTITKTGVEVLTIENQNKL